MRILFTVALLSLSISSFAQLRPISRPAPGQENMNVPLPPRPSAADEAMAQQFQSQKGKLPLPVVKSPKTKKAVVKATPTAEDTNPGIDILTIEKAPVRVVSEGLVARIFSSGGSDLSMIVQHGNIFSVYSGLASVNVKEGQHLMAKDQIGIVATKNGKPTLNFQIWKAGMKGQKEKLNPEEWLKIK